MGFDGHSVTRFLAEILGISILGEFHVGNAQGAACAAYHPDHHDVGGCRSVDAGCRAGAPPRRHRSSSRRRARSRPIGCRRCRSTASSGRRPSSATPSTPAASSPRPARPVPRAGTNQTPAQQPARLRHHHRNLITSFAPGLNGQVLCGRRVARRHAHLRGRRLHHGRRPGRAGSPPSARATGALITSFNPVGVNVAGPGGRRDQRHGLRRRRLRELPAAPSRNNLAAFRAERRRPAAVEPERRLHGLGAGGQPRTGPRSSPAARSRTSAASRRTAWQDRRRDRRAGHQLAGTNGRSRNAGRTPASPACGAGDFVYGTGYLFGAGGNLEGTFKAAGSTPATSSGSTTATATSTRASCTTASSTPPATRTTAATWAAASRSTRPVAVPARAGLDRHASTGEILNDVHGYPNWHGVAARPGDGQLAPGHGDRHLHRPVPGRLDRRRATATTSSYGGEFPTVNGVGQQGLVRFGDRPIAPGEARVRGSSTARSCRRWLRPRPRRSGSAGRPATTATTTPDLPGDPQRRDAPGLHTTGELELVDPAAHGLRRHRADARADLQLPGRRSATPTATRCSARPRRSRCRPPFAAADRVRRRRCAANGARSTGRSTRPPAADHRPGRVADVRGRYRRHRRRADTGVTWDQPGAITGDTAARSATTIQPGLRGQRPVSASCNWRTETRPTRSRSRSGSRPPRTTRRQDPRLRRPADTGTRATTTGTSTWTTPAGCSGCVRRTASRGPSSSSKSYNDSQWHQVTATMSPTGMALYVDGARVGQRADTTQGEATSATGGSAATASAAGRAQPTSTTSSARSTRSRSTRPRSRQDQIDRPVHRQRPDRRDPAGSGRLYGAAVYNRRTPTCTGGSASPAGTRRPTPATLSHGHLPHGVTLGPAGVVAGNTAGSAFNGSNGFVAPDGSSTNPTVYTEEAWFKTTSTTRGGKIIGFGNSRTGISTSYDRHVYMQDDGTLVFGVYTGQIEHDHLADVLQRRQLAPRGRHPWAATA